MPQAQAQDPAQRQDRLREEEAPQETQGQSRQEREGGTMRRQAKKLTVLTAVAMGCLVLAASAQADKEFDKYKIESVSASLSKTQAGAHADFTVGFELSATEEPQPKPFAFTRDVLVSLPPG